MKRNEKVLYFLLGFGAALFIVFLAFITIAIAQLDDDDQANAVVLEEDDDGVSVLWWYLFGNSSSTSHSGVHSGVSSSTTRSTSTPSVTRPLTPKISMPSTSFSWPSTSSFSRSISISRRR